MSLTEQSQRRFTALMRRFTVPLCACLGAMALLATPAGAAVGDLTALEHHVGDAGMAGARGVVVSPDGRNVYVAGASAGAVVTYTRAADGTLTYLGCVKDVGAAVVCADAAEGLSAPQYLAVSPDGKNVYASGGGADNAVVTLNRDPATGALTTGGCWRDTGSAANCGGNNAPALQGAEGVTVSSDGRNVYAVAQGDNSINTFARDAGTGALTYVSCISVAPIGCASAFTTSFSAPRALTSSTDGKGLYAGVANSGVVAFLRDPATGAISYADTVTSLGPALIVGVAVSPDDKHVYAGSVNRSAVYTMSRDVATGALTLLGCVKDVGAVSTCDQETEGLLGSEGVVVPGDGASLYSTGFFDSTLVSFLRSSTSGLLTPTGCFRDLPGPANGCAGQVEGLAAPRDVTASRDARSVYATGQADGGIAVFAREAVPGFVPGNGVFPPDGAPTVPPVVPPAPSPSPSLPDVCINPTTLLVTCADSTGAPGNCPYASTGFPQCQRPYALVTVCTTGRELVCSLPQPPALTACGSFGLALPECTTPTREVPGLCRPQGLGTAAAPICGIDMAPVTVCPPAAGTVVPACNFTVGVTTSPLTGGARTARAAARRSPLRVTLSCPRSLAARGCNGHVVAGALRTALRRALASQARTTADVYRYYVSGGAAFASAFASAASKAADRALAGTKIPSVVDRRRVVRDLGRDDALTNSFAGSLRRGANQYRALATGRRPSRSATGARAAATAGPASVPFRIAKGRRQTTISVPFSGAALRRLVADAGGRGRTPVRIVVAFHNGRRPIARFADVALRVAGR